MDLFIAPTIGFGLLYGFVIVRLARRRLVWINVTTNPTTEWIARQITEAFPWNEVIGIASMVPPSRTDYGLWAFVIGPSPQAHGRTASPKD